VVTGLPAAIASAPAPAAAATCNAACAAVAACDADVACAAVAACDAEGTVLGPVAISAGDGACPAPAGDGAAPETPCKGASGSVAVCRRFGMAAPACGVIAAPAEAARTGDRAPAGGDGGTKRCPAAALGAVAGDNVGAVAAWAACGGVPAPAAVCWGLWEGSAACPDGPPIVSGERRAAGSAPFGGTEAGLGAPCAGRGGPAEGTGRELSFLGISAGKPARPSSACAAGGALVPVGRSVVGPGVACA
jgi:hypothetical protein